MLQSSFDLTTVNHVTWLGSGLSTALTSAVSTFSNNNFFGMAGPIETRLHMGLPWVGEQKFDHNDWVA